MVVWKIVLRDLTCVLFDQKLLVQLMNPHQCQHLLTVQQCRILLTDIACCSLMRLDMTSMDKLWDLMIMLFKWQLCMIRESPSRLLELTFRHMDGVAKLMPEMKKTLLVDSTKRCLIEFWDSCSEDEMFDLLVKLLQWMQPFNVKISILIRSGFQRNDGTFETTPTQMYIDHFRSHLENIGENVYAKNVSASKITDRQHLMVSNDENNQRKSSISNELNSLASQLNISNDIVEESTDDHSKSNESIELKTVESAADVSSKNEKSDLIVDDVNCSMTVESPSNSFKSDSNTSEFVYLKKTTTTLQGYLEQFQLENTKSMENNADTDQSFDATEELLKMLEKENNEK